MRISYDSEVDALYIRLIEGDGLAQVGAGGRKTGQNVESLS